MNALWYRWSHIIRLGRQVAMFPSYNQAMSYMRWLFTLGLEPEYYSDEQGEKERLSA